LNLSQAAYKRAQAISLDDIFHEGSYGLSAEKRLPILFNLFEQLILNIVFACTAMEAFCNQMIPDDFVFVALGREKRSEKSFSKEQIERYISLDTKLAEVLPEVTGQRFDKGTSRLFPLLVAARERKEWWPSIRFTSWRRNQEIRIRKSEIRVKFKKI